MPLWITVVWQTDDSVRFAFPNLLLAPPYLFSGIGVGLMQIAAIIGFVIASFAGGYLADIITAIVIRKQKGAVYPEQRLIALLPGCLIAPVGCIVIAFACSQKLHWVAIAFGFGMGKHPAFLLGYSHSVQFPSERYSAQISSLPTSSSAIPDMPLSLWLRSMSLRIWLRFCSCTLLWIGFQQAVGFRFT